MWKKLRDEGPDMVGKLVSDMERLANTPGSGVSREQATRFGKEMEGFRAILRTYQAGLDSGSQSVDWSKVSTQNIDQIIQPYESCADNTTTHLDKLAIVKLNGGLGTTMGCTGRSMGGLREVLYRWIDCCEHDTENWCNGDF